MQNQTDEKKIMKEIERYAKHYYNQLTAQGFHVEYDDIFGELALTYAKAIKSYNPESGAKLSTYLSCCYQNAITDMKQDIADRWPHISIEQAAEEGDSSVMDQLIDETDLDVRLNGEAAIAALKEKAKPDWLPILDECIHPSPEVRRIALDIYKQRGRDAGAFIAAIALAHGLKEHQVHMRIFKLRRMANKLAMKIF